MRLSLPGATVTVKSTVVSVWFSLKSFTIVDTGPTNEEDGQADR